MAWVIYKVKSVFNMCAMDAKVTPSRISSDAPGKRGVKRWRFFEYVQELKEELAKVNWTTKEEIQLSTKVVVGSTFIFGLGIYLMDLVIKGCLDSVALFVRLIFG